MKKIFYFLCASWFILGYAEQTPFVILIPSYNNEKWAEENVKSALNQKYENFRVIYINDASTDKTLEIVQKIKEEFDFSNRLKIISINKNQGALKNIYEVVHQEIKDEEVVVLLDGDDRLAHQYVLIILNRVYCYKHPVWMTYGSYRWRHSHGIEHCQSLSYHLEQTDAYRKAPFVLSHLKTFKGWLFKKIKKEDFLYEGQFASYAWDLALMLPLVEMSSRGHFVFIPTILYDYNDENPISDFRKDRQLYDETTSYFLELPSYAPL